MQEDKDTNSEQAPADIEGAAIDDSYPDEDFEVLTATFGKGANKRKMLVTKGNTLKQLYNLSKED